MKNKYYLLLIILLSGVFLSTQGSATFITFKAEGTDNIPANFNEDPDFILNLNDPSANYFQITFEAGNSNESITEIRIDLRAGSDDDAFFDPSDGYKEQGVNDNGGGKGFGPVVGAETVGLSASDVTFSLDTASGTSPILEILFSANSFTLNDSLSFGIDIDFLGDGPDISNQRGGLFGSESVGLTTYLSGTCEESVSSTFSKESENRSVSEISICEPTTSISEPNILLLILSGLGLVYIFPITRLE